MSGEPLRELVEFIWRHAPDGEPDLTGLGRLRICTQNVDRVIREAVAAERERAAKVAETTTVFVGDFGEPNRTRFAVENMRKLAEAIAAAIREGR